MKKIRLIILLFLSFISCLSAQNYKTVRSDRVAYFSNQDSNVKCIRIDSIGYKSDSIYYFSPNIQQLDYRCFTPYGFSWIGKKMVIKPNFNLFFNQNNDTIFIKTNSKINEQWKAFNLKDSILVFGQVVKTDTMSFLGLKDSVKTIGFKVYDKTMMPLSMNLNSMTVMISKNYGFVKTINFSLFPNCEPNYFQEYLQNLSLIGLSKPMVGVQNLTWFEANDFKINDEIHVSFESSSWGGGNDYGYSTSQKTIYKYLNRIDYADSIKYYIDREESTFRRIVKWDSTSYSYIHDTLISVIRPNPDFDKYPDEPLIKDQWAFSQSMSNSNPISKTSPSVYGYKTQTNDSCWNELMADGCLYSPKYVKGLGGPYYSCTNTFSLGGEDRELVYYKKGSDILGTPLDITGIDNLENNDQFKLFPNPVNEVLWIKTDGLILPYSFELFDLNSLLLVKKVIISNLYSINLKGIADGLYVYRIVCNKGEIYTGKIIKH